MRTYAHSFHSLIKTFGKNTREKEKEEKESNHPLSDGDAASRSQNIVLFYHMEERSTWRIKKKWNKLELARVFNKASFFCGQDEQGERVEILKG